MFVFLVEINTSVALDSFLLHLITSVIVPILKMHFSALAKVANDAKREKNRQIEDRNKKKSKG